MTIRREIQKLYRRLFHYRPYYNVTDELSSDYPEIYNAEGQRLEIYFLADREFANEPYGTRRPRYIFWDRYNYGLKTHFYSHNEAFRLAGHPECRYAFLWESKAINPKSYEQYIRNKSYFENEFDSVFTYDDEVLGKIGNARFVPFCAAHWYGMKDPGIITPDRYAHKTRNVSILASHKAKTRMHVIRKELALKCKREGLADSFGTFDGGSRVKIEEPLRDYRYSIVVENDITPYYFTEKITNCFASQTVPVYMGASRIGEFFNTDGIITIDDAEKIDDVLRQCTPEEYMRRLPAILDNYERVKEYENPYDYMYAHYLRA